ncbi:thioredoxin family protein [Nocardia asiatica]|uniref:thioredoxin family protein n=1 Tax=Nocardia asiatica TaxID=209252 RepID=UPI0006888729|nr:thioredoxin family protein [Nocardia asiatica]
MPKFRLPDFTGHDWKSDEVFGVNGLLVVFLCNHCPYVKHIGEGLARLATELRFSGVATVGINSNDATRYPEDDSEGMREAALLYGYEFPYLVDAGQDVARTFGAVCTPDFFLFDQKHRLFYRGQMDDSRPRNGLVVTGEDIRNAVSKMLVGESAPVNQIPSLGCSIKWRENDA